MRLIDVIISMVSPMMMDKIDEASLRPGNGLPNRADDKDPRVIAERKIYRDDEGNPTVPTSNFLRCLIDAGKWFKIGRKQVTTKDSSIVTACVGIDPVPFLPLTFRDPWEVDTRPIRMLTGIRLSDRPMFHDWSLAFTLTLEDDLMGMNLLRDLVDAAGRRVGIGPFRPDRKGPFGKFAVTKWVEVDTEGTPVKIDDTKKPKAATSEEPEEQAPKKPAKKAS